MEITIFKNKLKKVLSNSGIEVYKRKTLPFGLDFCLDAYRKIFNYNVGVIFDIGANIGQTSSSLRKFFKSSDIFAFEPVRSTYNELVKNVAKDNINCHNIGMGDEREKGKIYLQQASSKNSLVSALNQPVAVDSPYEEVDISTVDLFCNEHNIKQIDLLKIDTEGFGLKVLSGARQMLQQGKIKSVFIEVGFSDEDVRHDNLFNVKTFLQSYNFNLFGFYDQWIDKSRLIYCNAAFALGSVFQERKEPGMVNFE